MNDPVSERLPHDQVSAVAPARGGVLLAILGLACSFVGIPAYMMTMNLPVLRSTGLLAWLFLAAGVAISLFVAVRRPRRLVRVLAGVNVALVPLWLYGFFVLAHLPAPAAPAVGAIAPAFTLPSTDGHDAALDTMLKQGPVLLVFYRGDW